MRVFRTVLVLALIALFALTGACAQQGAGTAAKPAAPHATKYKKFTSLVDNAFVKGVVDGKNPGVIIDSRPHKKKYLKGHIPTAVNLPLSSFDKGYAKVLPKDKNALLVFYCGGWKCPLSHKSAYKAVKLGYTNVKVLPTGYPGWKKAFGPGVYGPLPNLKFKQFQAKVGNAFVKEIVDGKKIGLIVDSRPKKKKYDKGHIPSAINIPLSQFGKMAGLLPSDKSTLVVFYCGGWKCPLSHKSAFKAKALGYTSVKVLPTGYPGWKKAYGAGTAMAAAKPAAAAKKRGLKAGKEEGSVDWAVFQKLAKNPPASVMFIDVRDASEYSDGHIKGAMNIAADDLEKKIASLPKDKTIIFVCSTGARSGEAFYMMQDQRPELKEVYYVDAEITYQKDGSMKLKKAK